MSIDALLVALASGLGGGALILALIRLGLPWVRRIIPVAVTISGALEASQARLVASLTAERVELEGQLKRCREEVLMGRAREDDP